MNMKNTSIIIVCLFLWIANTFAGEDYTKTTTEYKKVDIVDEYTKFYNEFKKEFEFELKNWNYTKIDNKIKWYIWDVNYLNDNKTSVHYQHIWVYQTKLKALQNLREAYSWKKYEEIKEVQNEKQKYEDKKEYEIQESKKIVTDNKTDVKKEIEVKKEIKTEIKTQIKEVKIEIKDQRVELRKKYKEEYKKVLEKKLETIGQTHMKVVSVRATNLIKDVEKSNIFETRKNVLIAQLEAIIEILEEKIQENNDFEIDLEKLFQN